VLLPAETGADVRPPLRRELLHLVLAVALLHALFIGGFFLLRLEHRSGAPRIGYTAAWTIATLVVVFRSLTRIRKLRRR
jgi:hypothetical protein